MVECSLAVPHLARQNPARQNPEADHPDPEIQAADRTRAADHPGHSSPDRPALLVGFHPTATPRPGQVSHDLVWLGISTNGLFFGLRNRGDRTGRGMTGLTLLTDKLP